MEDEDSDYAMALQLQEEYDRENAYRPKMPISPRERSSHGDRKSSKEPGHLASLNDDLTAHRVVDDSLELIDPTPDIHMLFQQFDHIYFKSKLQKVEVRWSPRMKLCAGLCCYEGFGGLCSIRLSKPLLALRPRKDLVETLLHEMIHAYLFVTHNNKDHNAHGPEFLSHMNRINKLSGANITVYHSFHDEVDAYRTHWWQCSGPCRHQSPYHGLVKRSMNRPPSQRDLWWARHQSACGGSFTKIKEPDSAKSLVSSKKIRNQSNDNAEKRKKTSHLIAPPKKLPAVGDDFLPFSGVGHRLDKENNLKPGSPKNRTIDFYYGIKNSPSHKGTVRVDNDVEVSAGAAMDLVICPICGVKISTRLINDHLDNNCI